MISIDVGTSVGRSYPILIEEGLLRRLPETLDHLGLGRRRLVVSTLPVWRLVEAEARRVAPTAEPLLIPDGERFKHLATVTRLYDGFVRASADRGSVVVAIGGGVVGDTVGFAAATFLRGLPVVHVPTTLLAQVDSAIGGKVGVNLPAGKNLVGAFHPPVAVAIDPVVLGTLPRREFRSGLYEVVKYAMIASPGLFERLTQALPAIFAREPSILQPVIAECCGIKARVVTEDEHERGLRKILNLGHTAGHALEAITKYRRFRHGEAVAYGMLAAAHVACTRGALPATDLEALTRLLAQMGPLPPVGDLSASEALDVMRRDKKVLDGRLHFVLPTRIGDTAIVTDVTERELVSVLQTMGLRD
jgi:3-dehydroquinate synthase